MPCGHYWAYRPFKKKERKKNLPCSHRLYTQKIKEKILEKMNFHKIHEKMNFYLKVNIFYCHCLSVSFKFLKVDFLLEYNMSRGSAHGQINEWETMILEYFYMITVPVSDRYNTCISD